MKNQISEDFNDELKLKINELVDQFATSSESLYNLFQEMDSKIAAINENISQ